MALAGAASGCLSISYVDSNNRRHVIGFVDITIEPGEGAASAAGPKVVTVTSLGVHLYAGSPNGSGAVLGYVREATVLLPDNSCVSLEAPGPCLPAASTSATAAATHNGQSKQ